MRWIVTAALIVSLCVPASFLLPTKVVEAQGIVVPVWDAPNTPNQYITGVATMFEKLKDFGLDTVAWIAAKMVIRQLTADLVDWINGGFDGNPAFLNDPGGFFLGVGDAVAGQYIFETGLSYLCNPIRPLEIEIKAGLLFNYQGYHGINYSCNLSTVFGNAVGLVPFINGDISVDAATGWDSWLSVTQIPQNNVYGANAIASAEIGARVSGVKELNKTVLDWNKGFKSVTDGINNAITTPGSYIQDRLYRVMDSDVYQLEAADEIGEMINAVAGALMNQVFTAGLTALSSNSGGGSYTDLLKNTDPSAYYEVSSSDQSLWSQNVSGENALAQETYEGEYQTAEDNLPPISGGGGGYIPEQDDRLRMSGLIASASAAQPSYEADKAIDGSTSTFFSDYKTGRGVFPWTNAIGPLPPVVGTTATTYRWWYVDLSSDPQYLDTIKATSWAVGWEPERYIILDENNHIHYGNVVKTGTLITVTIPASLRNTKIQAFGFLEDNYYQRLKEVFAFIRLVPEVDTDDLPTSLTNAVASAGFNPRKSDWVKTYYYAPGNIRGLVPTPPGNKVTKVEVKDPNGAIVLPSTPDDYDLTSSIDPLLYKLSTKGRYLIEYEAFYENLTSAKIERYITVQAPEEAQVPEVSTANVPASITFETASAGFNPRQTSWVTGYYYPSTTRQPIPNPPGNTAIEVFVENSAGVRVDPSTPDNSATATTDELRYILGTPGTYHIEYTATYEGLTSAVFEEFITVQQPVAAAQ